MKNKLLLKIPAYSIYKVVKYICSVVGQYWCCGKVHDLFIFILRTHFSTS